MFTSNIYKERRNLLKKTIKNGILFFPGNKNTPRNFASMAYPFRQDSSFLYYWGLDFPDLSAIIDVDNDKEIIFGDDRPVDDIVWMGPDSSMEEKASAVGVTNTEPSDNLAGFLLRAIQSGRKVRSEEHTSELQSH